MSLKDVRHPREIMADLRKAAEVLDGWASYKWAPQEFAQRAEVVRQAYDVLATKWTEAGTEETEVDD